LFSVKPVITMRNGAIEGESREHTRTRSLRYLADKVAAALPIRKLAVTNADAKDIDAFVVLLEPIFPAKKTITTYIGPIVGAHFGPGTIVVCLQRR
jgi:fatty acid-binding protein DegV